MLDNEDTRYQDVEEAEDQSHRIDTVSGVCSYCGKILPSCGNAITPGGYEVGIIDKDNEAHAFCGKDCLGHWLDANGYAGLVGDGFKGLMLIGEIKFWVETHQPKMGIRPGCTRPQGGLEEIATPAKSYGLTEIIEAIKKQANGGSCKTCMWCALLPEKIDGVPEAMYMCEIQDKNAIYISPEELDREPYPWKCDVGAWETDARGCDDEIYGCLAYQPGCEGAMCSVSELPELARKHRQFMRNLARAITLQNDIEANVLTQLIEKLNTAVDSLPIALTDNPWPWPPRDPNEPRVY